MTRLLERLKQGKLRIFLFFAIAILAMLLLSSGLSQLQFQPSQPLPLDLNMQLEFGGSPEVLGGRGVLLVIRIIFIVSLVAFPISIIYLILSPKARKELLKLILRFLPFLLTLVLIALIMRRLSDSEEDILGESGQFPEVQVPTIPPAVFNANPSDTLIQVVRLGLALLLTGVVLWVAWRYWRGRQKASRLQRLAEEAQQALDALETGADIRNIVIRCYYEMSLVLNEQRGIRRGQAMTPREFEQQLEGHGLPVEAIRSLTRLFEEARYGALTPGEKQERQAVDSLTAIVSACRGTV